VGRAFIIASRRPRAGRMARYSFVTVVPIGDLDDPRLADYRNVPDPALLAERGVFVAEGRLVVRALLTSRRFGVRSLLVTDAAKLSLEDALPSSEVAFPVYVASKTLMSGIVGFNVHRGCLAIGERPAESVVDAVLPPGGVKALAIVLERVANADNIAGFSGRGAFGADASSSPAAATRLPESDQVSIGDAYVPFARIEAPADLARLRDAGS
jgi:hypothetical protein